LGGTFNIPWETFSPFIGEFIGFFTVVFIGAATAFSRGVPAFFSMSIRLNEILNQFSLTSRMKKKKLAWHLSFCLSFLSLLEIPRGYSMEKALVSVYGPDDALKELGYFNHYIILEDILG
jgi:hypothetical protein